MDEPEVWFELARLTCQCGRPKYDAYDMKRWRIETNSGTGDDINPPWARVLCWTKPGFICRNRTLLQLLPYDSQPPRAR